MPLVHLMNSCAERCTAPFSLENKRAQHGNVSPVMGTETGREPPTFNRDAAMLAFMKTAPRLFTA